MRLDNKTREIIKTEVASQLGTEKEARYLERTANRLVHEYIGIYFNSTRRLSIYPRLFM